MRPIAGVGGPRARMLMPRQTCEHADVHLGNTKFYMHTYLIVGVYIVTLAVNWIGLLIMYSLIGHLVPIRIFTE